MAIGLGDLALIYAAVRQRNRQASKLHQEELLRHQQEMDLRKNQFEEGKRQFTKEQATAAAVPYLQVLAAPDAADRLANMATQKTLIPWLHNAQSASDAAGLGIDFSRYFPKEPAYDMGGTGPGSQAPPVGAPEGGLGMTPPQPGMSPPGTAIPRFQKLPQGMEGPPTPTAALPAERLGRMFAGLSPGMAGPPTPATLMPQPTPAPQPPPRAPWNEDEAAIERYSPGLLTRGKLGRMAAQNAESLFKQGVYRSQAEKNMALAEATRLQAHPRAQMLLAQAGFYDEQSQMMALLREPKLRATIAQAINLEDLPGSREADRNLRESEGEAGRALKREEGAADRALKREEGAANRATRKDIAYARAVPNRATASEKAQLETLKKVGWATERDLFGNSRVARSTDELLAEEPGATPQQLAQAKRVDAARSRYNALVSGIEGREGAVAPPRQGAPTQGGSQVPEAYRQAIIAGIGKYGLNGYLAKLTDPKLRATAKKVWAESGGR